MHGKAGGLHLHHYTCEIKKPKAHSYFHVDRTTAKQDMYYSKLIEHCLLTLGKLTARTPQIGVDTASGKIT